MFGQAFKYSYLNAKVRTIYANRLKKKDWTILKETENQETFLQYLSTTYYEPFVAKILQAPSKGLLSFERQIFESLFVDYFKLSNTLTRREKTLFLAMFSRFESENLKILLRAKKVGLLKKHVIHLLYPVESLSKLDWKVLWQTKELSRLFSILANTPFGKAISHALPQYEAHARLFPIEMAIEIASFRRISAAVSSLSSKEDRRMARILIGYFVDAKNLYHVARLRFVYGLSPEEALNYTYPGGYIFNLKRLHSICRAKDMKALSSQLPRQMDTFFEGTDSLFELRMKLANWLLKKVKKAFLGLPFHLGVEIAWVIYREIEIEGIVRLFRQKTKDLGRKDIGLVPQIMLEEE